MSLVTHRSSLFPHARLDLSPAAHSARRVAVAAAKEVYPAVITLSIFGTLIAGVLAIRLAAWFIRFHY